MTTPKHSRNRRRDFLRVGSLSALGLLLPDRFRNQSHAISQTVPKAKSCILIWLDGGPSHLETFDPKPDAPADVRGPFESITTNVPGIGLTEVLSRTARIMDKVALVRSMTSPLGEHGLANHYLLTGYKPSPVLEYPSYGSVVAKVRDTKTLLPPYVAIPESRSTAGAGFLGSPFQPFATGGDPAKPQFQVKDLDFFTGVNPERIDRRKQFLGQLDRFQQGIETAQTGNDGAFDQAVRLITSDQAKKAFDLSEESASLRAGYGPRTIGQSCLLARRLVERGVPFVTVLQNGWDTHDGLVLPLKEGFSGAKPGVGLIPTFDQAFSALIVDLDQRGLLKETLVIAMGEFGRTPKLNSRGGRDHWPRVFSLAMAGGGVRGGQVIGSSDRVGESPKDNPVTPTDLAHTIYSLLGIDPRRELFTADGRPIAINQGGKFIPNLI